MKDKREKDLKWLLRKSRYSIRTLWMIPIVCFCMSLCYVAISMIFKGYMDIASGDSNKTFFQMTIFSVSAIVVYAVTQILTAVLEGMSYTRIENKLRIYLLKKIAKKDLLNLGEMHSGEIQNRLTSDVATVSNFFIQAFGQMSLVLFTFLFAVVCLFILNWKMAIIFLIVIPLLTLLITVYSPKLQKAVRKDSENEDKNRSFMQEIIGQVPLLQVYSMNEVIEQKAEILFDKKRISNIRLSVLQGGFGFLNSLTSFGIFILTSAVGALFVINGENSVGDLVAMLQLSNYIMLPITEAPRWVSMINNTMNSVRRIREIEDIKEAVEVVHSNEDAFVPDSIVLNNLSFSYKDGKDVLENVNAEFKNNRIIGIIGKSGSGKSTLLKLLLGLYRPISDTMIKINSTVNSLNYYNCKKIISYVPSEEFVFNASVRENICMSGEYDREKFYRVCSQANIDELIKSLPNKEEEIIEEHGNNLSMGQRQRIAIARALYADAPIVIFDEPTANLDVESVGLFKKTVKKIQKEKMCFIVTHDMELSSFCDDVYRIEGGCLSLIEKR